MYWETQRIPMLQVSKYIVVKHMKYLKCGKNEFSNCRQNMGNHKPFHITELFKIFRGRHKFVESIINAIP